MKSTCLSLLCIVLLLTSGNTIAQEYNFETVSVNKERVLDIQKSSSYSPMQELIRRNKYLSYLEYLGFDTGAYPENREYINSLLQTASGSFWSAKQNTEQILFKDIIENINNQEVTVALLKIETENFILNQLDSLKFFVDSYTSQKKEVQEMGCTLQNPGYFQIYSPNVNTDYLKANFTNKGTGGIYDAPLFEEFYIIFNPEDTDKFFHHYGKPNLDSDIISLMNMVKATTFYISTKMKIAEASYQALKLEKENCTN